MKLTPDEVPVALTFAALAVGFVAGWAVGHFG